MSHKPKPKEITMLSRNPTNVRKVGGAPSSRASRSTTSLEKQTTVKGKLRVAGASKRPSTSEEDKEARISSGPAKSAVNEVHYRCTVSADGSDDVVQYTKSAAISKLEREVIELKNENSILKKELSEVKVLHEQLIHELPEERFTEKRVNLLKSQVAQLERQVVLMSNALGTRGELMVDLFNMMDWLQDRVNCTPKDPGSEEVLHRTASMKLRLSRYSQMSSIETLAQPVRFLDQIIKPKSHAKASFNKMGGADGIPPPVTLVDVCRRGLEHVNMKHVSRLESKLAELYGQLTQVLSALETTHSSSGSLLQPMREHCCDHVTRSCKLIGECCHDLLCLSLLVPTVPWPTLKGNEVSLCLSSGDILKGIPLNTRNRKEVTEAVEAAVQAFGYHSDMQERKLKALEKELQFHKSVYGLQIEYIESLFKAVRIGYGDFETSIQDMICTPVGGILKSYDTLTQTATDEALKDFLHSLKEHYPELKEAVRKIKRPKDSGERGLNALSIFGDQFFQQLHDLEQLFSKQRQELSTVESDRK